MLAELEDLHVWIELPSGRAIYPYRSRYSPNVNPAAVRARVSQLERFAGLGWVGRTAQGIAVLAVQSLPAGGDERYRQLLAAARERFDAQGFIVDLRGNSGGAETRAAEIAALFADRPYLYARSLIRVDGKMQEGTPRWLQPDGAVPFTRPVVCLIGPGCVSSGEGLALMMKSMEHVTVVGLPTRGASGNPRPVLLSNGVKVWFSRWVSLEADGTPIEGRGVLPDRRIEQRGDGDSAFDAAVQLLLENGTEAQGTAR